MNKKDNFYCFNNNFVYSCQDNCIFKVKQNLFEKIVQNYFDTSDLPEQDFYNLSYILDSNTFYLPEFHHDNAKITFANSNLCNLNCSYCHSSMRNDFKELTEDEIIKIIDYCIHIYRPNANGYIVSLNLSGEPLINSNILNLMLKIKEMYSPSLNANNKWIFMSFITNGTVITDENIKMMKKLNITEQTVSIDGPEEVHNEYSGVKTSSVRS
jgi:MoaA/NifB/PqqE/SkfB family radical SAM enzyme